ncbi:hypothetical protein XM38_021210 [Halomicronema hongdechloris C2206]|uniref:Uncharacterized protein n=1 Tax=Halomicronema hongdechloris C2206 TaxID=1641165 RepID=A0A1Z3HLI8_9CYAN|nr:hypothetical protein XM38_021210 [Halomicronema hongdechloris C2206]
MQDGETLSLVEKLIRELGGSDCKFKRAVIVAIADSNAQMQVNLSKKRFSNSYCRCVGAVKNAHYP